MRTAVRDVADVIGKYKVNGAFPLRVHGAPFAMGPVVPGHERIDARSLGLILPVAGGARGYNTEGDVITQTTDGRDLNDIWAEYQRSVALQNAERQALVDFLTFPVTNIIEDVPQISGDDFEEASEFGVPKGIRAQVAYFSLAYDFKWYDIATRYTWKFLAEATAQQVDSVHASVLDADNRLVFSKVMKTLFNNVNTTADIRNNSFTVYKLYNADGTVPPSYKGNNFAGSHTHYLTSGAATIDSGDLEAMIEHLRHHGYSDANGVRLVFLMNPSETAYVKRFRANTVNNNGASALYDFVPAQGSAPFLLPGQGMVGNQPPSTLAGMTVVGQYGPALIVEEDYIPSGYVVLIGTGGRANLNNPVGIREHAQVGLRGLRLVKGADPNYPLTDAYYSRGFGTGVRQRGGAAVMQITASGTYTIPSLYV